MLLQTFLDCQGDHYFPERGEEERSLASTANLVKQLQQGQRTAAAAAAAAEAAGVAAGGGVAAAEGAA
jgi:hypothetical protein